MEDGVSYQRVEMGSIDQRKSFISPLLPRAEVDAIAEMLSKHKTGKRTAHRPHQSFLPKEGILGDGTLSDAIRQSHGGCVEPGLPAFLGQTLITQPTSSNTCQLHLGLTCQVQSDWLAAAFDGYPRSGTTMF
jgi:hypothetical protein